ncbi:hypothetical protein O0L34_g9691 [Tuta absoluta]|nr:hypothetical protein O0L34_g9691 [Tuta absoluta]
MCLWLITACLGMLPTNPSPTIIVIPGAVPGGVPPPILLPTTAATTAATAAPVPIPGATTLPTPAPTVAPPSTAPPTAATTATSAPPTAAPTAPPSTAPPTTTTIGANLLSVLVCNNPDAICVSNPDDDAGTLAIDPRLGSSPRPSAALQAQPPQIQAYTAQLEPNPAVRFPREKRSTEIKHSVKVKDALMQIMRMPENKHEIRKRQTTCRCVPAGTCASATNGAGLIDVRIVTPGVGAVTCPAGQVYCCGPTTTVACGALQTVPVTSIPVAAGQASFGEFPWQAMILTKQNDYLAGGVLIDQLNVLTVTHRLVNYIVGNTAPNVKVRLGEWDAAVTTEPVPFKEYNVAKVFTHPSYVPTTLQYDITVLRLSAPVPLTPEVGSAPTINRVCLPPAATTSYTGQRCQVAGWGKNQFGLQGLYQQIMKKVDVPIVAPATCQVQLQAARLGPTYILDTTSFVCAGGEANKDACTGDGGSGLVCNVGGSWVLVGLVSWGLGCANANVPGVYVNVPALLPWIQQQVATP